MRMTRVLAALTLALSLVLTACGSGDSDQRAKTSTTEHNAGDVAFATEMIPHHAQALSMADLIMGRSLDPEISALVEDIRMVQGPEIEIMVTWLTDWDEEIPETMRDHGNAPHDDGDGESGAMQNTGDMPGMMSADQMTALENASGTEFQQMWLTMMIEHHEGALAMAKKERVEGQFKPAVELAEAIISAQEKEISAMKRLLS